MVQIYIVILENSFGLLLFLKQAKNHKNKLWYVFIRITVNGKRKELSPQRLLAPGSWNYDNGCACGSDNDAKNLNIYLETYREKVYQAKRLLMDMGKDLSAGGIKDILMGKGEGRKRILVVFQFHNDQMRQLVGNGFAKGTLERYETSKEHTRSFIQWKYKVDDLDIRRLDHEFISKYSFWLKKFRNCGHNSTVKYLKYSPFTGQPAINIKF